MNVDNNMIPLHSKIYVAGHRGMVGSAICRYLTVHSYDNIIIRDRHSLDLTRQLDVRNFFDQEHPEYVFLAAAKVGGIGANRNNPYEFLRDNLIIQDNIINESFKHNVKKLIFLGSSCIYPCECLQPMKEEYLLTGPLEATNEGYALAKIAGLRSLQYLNREYGFDSLSVMPCNLYGPNDSFSPENSHVLAALVKKFADAKTNGMAEVVCWGTGCARREFLHVDDMVRGIFLLLENNPYGSEIINIGSGFDSTIKELANIIANITGFNGKIIWDASKPDGMLRKCMDISKITKLGFNPQITLLAGIKQMLNLYLRQKTE